MPYKKGDGVVQKYIGRIVVVLTPVFVGLAAYGATQVEKLPGHPQLDETELVALMVLAASSGIGAVVTWLVNLGKHERQVLAHRQNEEMEAIYESQRAEMAPEPGSYAELLEKPIGEAVPLLRAHLGLEAEIPSAELVLAALAETRAQIASASAAVGAVSERLDSIEADRAGVVH